MNLIHCHDQWNKKNNSPYTGYWLILLTNEETHNRTEIHTLHSIILNIARECDVLQYAICATLHAWVGLD